MTLPDEKTEHAHRSGYDKFLAGLPIHECAWSGESAGWSDALADTVRDLATAVRQLMGNEPHDTLEDVTALRERLAQIKPRGE